MRSLLASKLSTRRSTISNSASAALDSNVERPANTPITNAVSPVAAGTKKQRQVLLLYYMHQKTHEEVAEIMGIPRRVVSQNLFGICRDGKHVGGAIKKIQKICRQQGLALQN